MTSRAPTSIFWAFSAFLLGSESVVLRAAQANLWIATNNNGPQVPFIEVLQGSFNNIDIWARPEPGMNLGGFSLNLVSTSAGTITFDSVEVLNPEQMSSNARRHQLIFDSSVSWEKIEYDEQLEPVLAVGYYDEEHLHADYIEDFFGATFVNDSDLEDNGVGIGPECDDDECHLINGQPAWRIASVTFIAGDSPGITELFLEIGEQGIWHRGDSMASTTALFGNPDDGNLDDVRSWTPITTGGHGGLPDAVIQVVSQLSNADFDESGLVDGLDFLIWQRGFNLGSIHSEGDANLDGMVDETDLLIWQAQFGSSPASFAVVPEPSSTFLHFAVCVSLFWRLNKVPQ